MLTILGNERKTLDQLCNIPIIRPARAGAHWRGVEHYQLASSTIHALQNRGIVPINQAWSVDKSGQYLVGGVTEEFPAVLNVGDVPGLHFCLGLRHSKRRICNIIIFKRFMGFMDQLLKLGIPSQNPVSKGVTETDVYGTGGSRGLLCTTQ